MISPTTSTTLPGTGLAPTGAAATVVTLHGCLDFLPIAPAGSSYVPLVGVISGNRMPVACAAHAAVMTSSKPPTIVAARVKDLRRVGFIMVETSSKVVRFGARQLQVRPERVLAGWSHI